MGLGRSPAHRPLLENPDILVFAWGATVPMIAHAAGIELDEITTTWDEWVTPVARKTAKGIIEPGNVAAVRFTAAGVGHPSGSPADCWTGHNSLTWHEE